MKLLSTSTIVLSSFDSTVSSASRVSFILLKV